MRSSASGHNRKTPGMGREGNDGMRRIEASISLYLVINFKEALALSSSPPNRPPSTSISSSIWSYHHWTALLKCHPRKRCCSHPIVIRTAASTCTLDISSSRQAKSMYYVVYNKLPLQFCLRRSCQVEKSISLSWTPDDLFVYRLGGTYLVSVCLSCLHMARRVSEQSNYTPKSWLLWRGTKNPL